MPFVITRDCSLSFILSQQTYNPIFFYFCLFILAGVELLRNSNLRQSLHIYLLILTWFLFVSCVSLLCRCWRPLLIKTLLSPPPHSVPPVSQRVWRWRTDQKKRLLLHSQNPVKRLDRWWSRSEERSRPAGWRYRHMHLKWFSRCTCGFSLFILCNWSVISQMLDSKKRGKKLNRML